MHCLQLCTEGLLAVTCMNAIMYKCDQYWSVSCFEHFTVWTRLQKKNEMPTSQFC